MPSCAKHSMKWTMSPHWYWALPPAARPALWYRISPEQMRAECLDVDDDGVECVFDGWVTAMVTNELTTWTCPECDAEHEDNTRDRFDDN